MRGHKLAQLWVQLRVKHAGLRHAAHRNNFVRCQLAGLHQLHRARQHLLHAAWVTEHLRYLRLNLLGVGLGSHHHLTLATHNLATIHVALCQAGHLVNVPAVFPAACAVTDTVTG